MLKCLLLNDSTKVQIILLIKKRGSRKLNFAFYCVFICVYKKNVVLLQRFHGIKSCFPCVRN